MAEKQFNIVKLVSTSTTSTSYSYTFSTAYRYVLVMTEADQSANNVSISGSASKQTLYSLTISNGYDYGGSHNGKVYLFTDVPSGGVLSFTSSWNCAIHIYALSTDLKNEISFTQFGYLNNNYDTSDTTRSYTTSQYFDAVFIHEIMGEVDEMPSGRYDTISGGTVTWTQFVHSGHDGNTTGAMATSYAAKVNSGTRYSITTQNHPVSGYEDVNQRSYVLFGITINIIPSKIYRGSTNVEKIYLKDTEISQVWLNGEQIFGS